MGRWTQLTDVTSTNPNLPYLALPTFASVYGANLMDWRNGSSGITLGSGESIAAQASLVSAGPALVQATSGSQLTLVPNAKNGLPGIVNPSGSDFLLGASGSDMVFATNQPFTAGVVMICGSSRGTYEYLYGCIESDFGPLGWAIDCGSQVGSFPALRFRGYDTAQRQMAVNSGVALVAGTAYHLTFTYDGSGTAAGIRIYLNGVLLTGTNVVSDALNGSNLNFNGSNAPFLFASGGYGNCTHTILEAYAVNRVATASEIAATDLGVNSRYAIH